MVTCQAAVVLVMVLMAVTMGGCATQSTTEPSATPSMDRASAGDTGAGSMEGAGVKAGSAVRPRLADFAANGGLSDIHFDFDSYEIRSSDRAILDASVTWLRAHPDALVLIEGHADERGTNEYNIALGERRARASMHYLVSHGIQAGRMTLISYGEERATCRERTEGCWSKNRRAHFLVKLR
jgi:peptidoglycan-associated lipoprotein